MIDERTLYFLLYMDYKAECQRQESEPFDFAGYVGFLARGQVISALAKSFYEQGLCNGND